MRQAGDARTIKAGQIEGKAVRCYICGEGGGTLVKVGDERYCHDRCRRVRGKNDKAI